MAWTQADVDALKLALKNGVKRVQYRDRVVEYPSISEMLELLGLMEAEASGTTGRYSRATHYRD